MKKEDLTKKYMEFQLLNQQIQQQQQQMQMISHQVSELKALNTNIEEISKAKTDSEMYTNLGVGVHVKSKIADIQKLLVNVGSGVYVKKAPKETVELIKKQITELEKFTKNLEANLQTSIQRAESIREEIAEAQKEK